MWIWIAVLVVALIILIVAVGALLGRLSGLRRAGERVRLRRTEAMRLRESVAALEQSVQGLQERAEQAQRRIAVIKAGRGAD